MLWKLTRLLYKFLKFGGAKKMMECGGRLAHGKDKLARTE
jgi:hypothetical protein